MSEGRKEEVLSSISIASEHELASRSKRGLAEGEVGEGERKDSIIVKRVCDNQETCFLVAQSRPSLSVPEQVEKKGQTRTSD